MFMQFKEHFKEGKAEKIHKIHKIHKSKKVVFTIFFVLLTIFIGVMIVNEIKRGKYIGQDVQNTISFSATGKVFANPDLALTTFSVITEEKTATQALTKNSESMNNVIEFMKSQGVEDKDLKTTVFNIYPRYEWHESKSSYYPQGERVLVGYEVRQSLEVKIRDMEKIGVLIEGATNAGANEVGSLQFTFDNEDELKAQAREQAIDKAKEKAKELAIQLGVKLGKITDFQEDLISPIFYEMKAASEVGGGATPQIETGQSLISSSVIITYEIY